MTSSCFPRCGLALPTITLHSISSIFQEKKLEPGIYKIQNILAQTFVDVEDHRGGKGARTSDSVSLARVPEDHK